MNNRLSGLLIFLSSPPMQLPLLIFSVSLGVSYGLSCSSSIVRVVVVLSSSSFWRTHNNNVASGFSTDRYLGPSPPQRQARHRAGGRRQQQTRVVKGPQAAAASSGSGSASAVGFFGGSFVGGVRSSCGVNLCRRRRLGGGVVGLWGVGTGGRIVPVHLFICVTE